MASPKQVIGVAKYMYIKRLLDDFNIDLIFDVGANIGQFGQSMREIGYRGEIISFEPVVHQFERLRSATDSKWKAMNVALGATDEKRTINIMQQTVFSSFNTPSVASTEKFAVGNKVVRTEEVHIRRLADIIRELNLSDRLERCFLKCDTQGFDRHVLEGSGEYLEAVRMMMLEVSAVPIYENSLPMAETIQYLVDLQFLPVALFPITFLRDWSAVEFDWLGVNQRYRNERTAI
jgi:FkbM family methyltransferase